MSDIARSGIGEVNLRFSVPCGSVSGQNLCASLRYECHIYKKHRSQDFIRTYRIASRPREQG